MESLNKEWVQTHTSHDFANVEQLPEKVLQFGEGNFLRGFVDWMLHKLNQQGLFNGRIVAVQPTPHGKVVPKLNAQDGLYTLVLRGIENGETVENREIITSISRGINPYANWESVLEVAASPDIEVVFSNTTEAGLTYSKESFQVGVSPASFPAKLTACMYHRFQTFQGDPNKGWFMIPCELINNNGSVLRDLVLRIAQDWNLPDDFRNWVEQYNFFYNTLVDRIVVGFPKDEIDRFQDELGYEDQLLTVGEPYHLFVLDGNEAIQEKIPFHKAGLNVHWGDITPYREIKVRVLNGAHTLMTPMSILHGKATVQDVMNDPKLLAIVKKGIYEEILPVLHVSNDKKVGYTRSVLDRFCNPFNPHSLFDIALNSISKFKARVLPSFLEYVETCKKLPPIMTYSLAALIYFYKGIRFEDGKLFGSLNGQEYAIRDSEDVLLYFYESWNESDNVETTVEKILSNQSLWDVNLLEVPELKESIVEHLQQMIDDPTKFQLAF